MNILLTKNVDNEKKRCSIGHNYRRSLWADYRQMIKRKLMDHFARLIMIAGWHLLISYAFIHISAFDKSELFKKLSVAEDSEYFRWMNRRN